MAEVAMPSRSSRTLSAGGLRLGAALVLIVVLAILAIAVVIWALVATEPELATFANVRLEYKNLPDGLEISSEPVSSVMLELKGPSGALRGTGEVIHPAVVLDMSDAQTGEHTFSIG